jgi:hypothetical protein
MVHRIPDYRVVERLTGPAEVARSGSRSSGWKITCWCRVTHYEVGA